MLCFMVLSLFLFHDKVIFQKHFILFYRSHFACMHTFKNVIVGNREKDIIAHLHVKKYTLMSEDLVFSLLLTPFLFHHTQLSIVTALHFQLNFQNILLVLSLVLVLVHFFSTSQRAFLFLFYVLTTKYSSLFSLAQQVAAVVQLKSSLKSNKMLPMISS